MIHKLRVALKPYHGKIFLHDNIFSIFNGHNIFAGLDKRLLKRNIIIHTYDMWGDNKPDVWVYCDVPYPWEIGLWEEMTFHKKNNILFNFESPLINPFSQMPLLQSYFKKIYTWDDNLVDNRKYYKFNIPQVHQSKPKQPSFEKKKLLTCIISNKRALLPFIILSKHKTDLYKERYKAIEYFGNKIPNDFDLYGHGWAGTMKNNEYFRGEATDKLEALSRYRFSLAFENCAANGYITEKIFDCFQAGVVPIYLGAKNIQAYIDPAAFIDVRKFKLYDSLLSYITNLSDDAYKDYLKRAELLLGNKQVNDAWFDEGFERLLTLALIHNN